MAAPAFRFTSGLIDGPQSINLPAVNAGETLWVWFQYTSQGQVPAISGMARATDVINPDVFGRAYILAKTFTAAQGASTASVTFSGTGPMAKGGFIAIAMSSAPYSVLSSATTFTTSFNAPAETPLQAGDVQIFFVGTSVYPRAMSAPGGSGIAKLAETRRPDGPSVSLFQRTLSGPGAGVTFTPYDAFPENPGSPPVIGEDSTVITFLFGAATGSGETPGGDTVNLSAVLQLASSYSPSQVIPSPSSSTLTAGGPPVQVIWATEDGIEFDGEVVTSDAPAVASGGTTDLDGVMLVTPGIVAGTAQLRLNYTRTDGTVITGLFIATVDAPAVGPSFGEVALPGAVVGQPYQTDVVAANATSYSVTGLPSGLTFSWGLSGAHITGVPTAAGTYSITITATNDVDSASVTVSLFVASAGGGGSQVDGDTVVEGPADFGVAFGRIDLTAGDFLSAAQALMPTGLVWPREPDSVQVKLLRGLVESQTRQAGRALDLLADVFPQTTIETLMEWEATLGLPDPCAGESPTLQQRRRQVVARLVGLLGQSIQQMTAYALMLGYVVSIGVDAPFRVGINSCADPIKGEAFAHLLSIQSPLTTFIPFRCGHSGCNEPLITWGNAVLECELAALRPAHAILQFRYI